MKYTALKEHIYNIEEDDRDNAVLFGCTCGCGGDSYNTKSWDHMVEASDKSRMELLKLGVLFND